MLYYGVFRATNSTNVVFASCELECDVILRLKLSGWLIIKVVMNVIKITVSLPKKKLIKDYFYNIIKNSNLYF